MNSNIKTYTLEFVNDYILHVENAIKMIDNTELQLVYQSKISDLNLKLTNIHDNLAILINDIHALVDQIHPNIDKNIK